MATDDDAAPAVTPEQLRATAIRYRHEALRLTGLAVEFERMAAEMETSTRLPVPAKSVPAPEMAPKLPKPQRVTRTEAAHRRSNHPFLRWLNGRESLRAWAKRHGIPYPTARSYTQTNPNTRRSPPPNFRALVERETAGAVPASAWDAV